MRKAAERGDQDKSTEGTYIDPYAGSSPSVKEELKQWLSPAAQRKRLMGRGNSPPERKERTPTRSKPRHQGDEAEGQEQMTGESYCSSEEDRRMRERKGRRRGQARRGNDDEEWDERSSYSRRRHQPSSWYGEYGPPPPPPHPAYTAPNPWISPHRVPPIPSYDPRLLHTIGPDYPSYAIPQHATSTPDHQRRHSSGDPNHPFTVPTLVIPAQTKESGQGDHVRSNVERVTLQSSSPQGQSSTAPQQIPVTIQIQQSPTSTQHDRSPQPFTSMTESATKGESRLNTSDRSETVSTGVGTSPLRMPMNAPFDERGLPMLLDELGATKDKNQVLSEKCSEAKLEIESLKMQLGVKDAMSEAEIAAKGASLIEEIYTAQREHDAAIMSRLNLANDERDDAFARLQRYHSKDGFDSGTDVNSNEEDNTPADASLNNLLTRLTVADNRSSISKYGSAIIGRISKTKGRREEITSEEMRAILKEKDIAVAKCKKLEREVIELRRNKESSKSRNNNEKSLKVSAVNFYTQSAMLPSTAYLIHRVMFVKSKHPLYSPVLKTHLLTLIEEIYTAQREHDAAIMSRLNLANDERDDAFARLQRYHSKDGFDSGTDVNSNEEDNTPADSSLNNLLTRLTVADNRSSISKYGSAIIGRISQTKGRREEITSEEMRAILKEKDIAVAKCKKLEREVIELRRNKESSKSRNNNEKSLKAQLDITRDERDKALVAAKKRKDEIESLKVYYSLHKSLSQEANMRDQFNNTLGSIEEQVKTRDEVLARTQQNNSQLAQQVRAANDERNKMVVQLQRFEQENQHLKSKTHHTNLSLSLSLLEFFFPSLIFFLVSACASRLERLVAVLRKKVTEGTVKTV
eukprot:XP_011675618.1 PREDICTED: uncharacterized protein LOC578530 [Strongylocentrotus purpuratus]